MKLLLQNIILPFYAEDGDIINVAAERMKRSGVDPRTLHFQIYKKSFDARRKDDIKAVCSVIAESEWKITAEKIKRSGAVEIHEEPVSMIRGKDKLCARPLVVGMGPAGMFCALMLAENGYAPILIDRGVYSEVGRIQLYYRAGCS